MRDYLEGYRFRVITDHQSLKWFQKIESATGRLGRWAFELQQYNFEIQYRRGPLNRVADALSHQGSVQAVVNIRCPYKHMLTLVSDAPQSVPDLRIENGRLYKHVLHSLDFKDVPPEEQWKKCVPRGNREQI